MSNFKSVPTHGKVYSVSSLHEPSSDTFLFATGCWDRVSTPPAPSSVAREPSCPVETPCRLSRGRRQRFRACQSRHLSHRQSSRRHASGRHSRPCACRQPHPIRCHIRWVSASAHRRLFPAKACLRGQQCGMSVGGRLHRDQRANGRLGMGRRQDPSDK